MSDEYIENGIKIQRLPTVGKAISYRTRKQRGYSGNVTVSTSQVKKIAAIKKVLRDKEKSNEPN